MNGEEARADEIVSIGTRDSFSFCVFVWMIPAYLEISPARSSSVHSSSLEERFCRSAAVFSVEYMSAEQCCMLVAPWLWMPTTSTMWMKIMCWYRMNESRGGEFKLILRPGVTRVLSSWSAREVDTCMNEYYRTRRSAWEGVISTTGGATVCSPCVRRRRWKSSNRMATIDASERQTNPREPNATPVPTTSLRTM